MNVSDSPPIPNIYDETVAAFDWWREAGVDLEFTDDATSWLQEPAPSPGEHAAEETETQPQSALLKPALDDPPRPESTTARVDFFAGSKPTDIDEFRDFWLSAPALDAIASRGRVPPRGPASADLMVLVVDPEETDRERLLSGPRGRLVENILSATGMRAETVYFASALPRHMPMADTASLAAGGLDEVLLHHVTLANPRKILAFGAQLTPFIAEPAAQPQTSLRNLKYKSSLPPVLAAEGLDSLLETPALKARFWRRWMEWSAD
jgi:DNA polymerase